MATVHPKDAADTRTSSISGTGGAPRRWWEGSAISLARDADRLHLPQVLPGSVRDVPMPGRRLPGLLQLRLLDEAAAAVLQRGHLATSRPSCRKGCVYHPSHEWPRISTEYGNARVTKREAEVLSALGERLTNAEIAARLFVSERTVESHVSALRRKLEASSRLEGPARPRPRPRQTVRCRARSSCSSTPAGTSDGGRTRPTAGAVAPGARRPDGRRPGLRRSGDRQEPARRRVHCGGQCRRGCCSVRASRTATRSTPAVRPGDRDRHRRGVRLDAAPMGRSDSSSLGRIVPEIDRRCDRPTAAGETDLLDGQSGAAAAVCRYLTRLATDGPVVCVLEDVHWATPTTLATVRFLAQRTRAPVLVVLTTRDTPPDVDEGLKVFLSELARIPSVESIPLAGLPAADVATLLDRLGATVDAAAVAADTKGNPLLVREVANSSPGTATSLYALLAGRCVARRRRSRRPRRRRRDRRSSTPTSLPGRSTSGTPMPWSHWSGWRRPGSSNGCRGASAASCSSTPCSGG